MADTKISGLAAGAPAQAGDLIPIARSGANYSITPANILAYGTSPVAGTSGTFSTTLGVTGASTLAALSATTGAFTGRISTTQGGTSIDGVSIFPATNTDRGLFRITNLSSDTIFGAQGSATNDIITTGASAYDAAIRSTSGISFSANNGSSTQMRLSSTGLAVTGTGKVSTGFAVGNATPGAGGVAFPATAVAVADANTLDDYKEGSFTAVMTGMGGAGATVTAYYTKIGNAVVLDIPEFGGPSTSTAKAITGMPAAIQPTSLKRFPIIISDNNGAYVMAVSTLQTSTFNIYATPGAGIWTASGNAVVENIVVSYTLN